MKTTQAEQVRPRFETFAEASLEIWARATIDLETPDLERGHSGRSRMSQRETIEAARDALIVLSTLARARRGDV